MHTRLITLSDVRIAPCRMHRHTRATTGKSPHAASWSVRLQMEGTTGMRTSVSFSTGFEKASGASQSTPPRYVSTSSPKLSKRSST